MRRFAPLLALLAACLLPSASPGQAGLDGLARHFHIDIRTSGMTYPVQTAWGPLDGSDAPADAVARYSPLLTVEFGRYPVQLVRRVKLKEIVLLVGLTFRGQRRNAFPDWQAHRLYLEVERGSGSPGYLRRVIHHEFFHMIDQARSGNVYRDKEWAALNPPGFAYGDGGVNRQDRPATGAATESLPGFLNDYATSGVEEDKAEVYAFLVTDPSYVLRRASAEPLLAAKMAMLKEQMQRYCREMDQRFWGVEAWGTSSSAPVTIPPLACLSNERTRSGRSSTMVTVATMYMSV